MKKFKELELLVTKIQKDLAPNAEVLHNQYLLGRQSKRKRQIDILVRDQIGPYTIQIVIDCKDYKRPVDVKAVEAFSGLLKDVGAQKGVLVCPAGFTQSAKNLAQWNQIDLFSPIDTDPHKWQVKAEIPALIDFRSAAISIELSNSSPGPFTIPFGFQFSTSVLSSSGDELGPPMPSAISKWNAGRLPIEPGLHERLPIYDYESVLMDNGHGQQVPVNLSAHLRVECQMYFGQIPITKISGFKDEIEGYVIANAFEFGVTTPDEVIENWTPIESEEEAPILPVIKLVGLVGWDEDSND